MEFDGQGRVKQGGSKHETNDRGSIGALAAGGGCDGPCSGESGTKPVVYVYAQVVASDGKTLVTNAVGIVCNNSNWAVLGKLSSDAELMLQSGYSYAKGMAEFQTVTNEAESEKLTRYPVNAGVSLSMVTWDDLKCLSGTHDGYKGSVFADRTDANDGGSTAYHLDGTIMRFDKASFDANAEGTQTGNMPKDGYYLRVRPSRCRFRRGWLYFCGLEGQGCQRRALYCEV